MSSSANPHNWGRFLQEMSDRHTAGDEHSTMGQDQLVDLLEFLREQRMRRWRRRILAVGTVVGLAIIGALVLCCC